MLHGAGIFSYIYPKNHLNVGKYTIHRASGKEYQVSYPQTLLDVRLPWPDSTINCTEKSGSSLPVHAAMAVLAPIACRSVPIQAPDATLGCSS